MKRFFKLATLCMVVALFVTGCGMKEEIGIKIGKDKKVSIEMIIAQDNEMIDAMLSMGQDSEDGKTYTDKDRWEYLENSESDESYQDFKKVKYDKDGYKGYTYTLDLGDIENLVAEGDKISIEDLGKDSKFFTKKGDVYTLNIELGSDQAQQKEQYKSSVDLDITMKVTLPNKAKSNNATKVDGNTYIWDLTKAKSIELSFDLTGKSSNNNSVLIAGAACAVVAIGIGVVVLTKKKNA